MSNHLTNRSIIGSRPPQTMNNRSTTAFFVLALLLFSGCLGAMGPDGLTTDTVTPPNEPWSPAELPDDWSNIVARTRGSPNLIGFTDCDQLEQTLKDHIAEEMRVHFLEMLENDWGYYGWGWAEDDMMMDGDAVAESSSADTAAGGDSAGSSGGQQTNREEGTDFSGTNNQEEGVDEADFVKTDGYYIYMLQNNRLFILGTPEPGQLTYESNITIEGSPMTMMLTDDHLVIMSTVSSWNLNSDDPLYDLLYDADDYWWRSNTSRTST